MNSNVPTGGGDGGGGKERGLRIGVKRGVNWRRVNEWATALRRRSEYASTVLTHTKRRTRAGRALPQAN